MSPPGSIPLNRAAPLVTASDKNRFLMPLCGVRSKESDNADHSDNNNQPQPTTTGSSKFKPIEKNAKLISNYDHKILQLLVTGLFFTPRYLSLCVRKLYESVAIQIIQFFISK